MKTKVLVAAGLLCVMTIADVIACGNKFLVPSRGTRFGRAPIARQDAKILVYAPPGSATAAAIGDLDIAMLLAEVGYRPTTVAGRDELDAALGEGDWNLVLADAFPLPDTLTAGDAPAILPVLHEPTRTQIAEARKTYGQVINALTKSQRLVETVDYAVAAHLKTSASEVETTTAR